jgi:hypothetical protein
MQLVNYNKFHLHKNLLRHKHIYACFIDIYTNKLENNNNLE